MFAGLTSLSTRTTSVHNISCDGVQSWQTEKQHEKSPFLQHFHHKLSRLLPNFYQISPTSSTVWSGMFWVLSNQPLLVCVRVPSTGKDLYTHSTNAATEGATEIASMDIILSFLLLFFALSTQTQSAVGKIKAARMLLHYLEQVLQGFCGLHARALFLKA